MVYSRLARRLRATGINSFATYLNMLEREVDSRVGILYECMTTNLTSFFREEHHFLLALSMSVRSMVLSGSGVQLSSTGEEPYSIAMTVCEAQGTMTPFTSDRDGY